MSTLTVELAVGFQRSISGNIELDKLAQVAVGMVLTTAPKVSGGMTVKVNAAMDVLYVKGLELTQT